MFATCLAVLAASAISPPAEPPRAASHRAGPEAPPSLQETVAEELVRIYAERLIVRPGVEFEGVSVLVGGGRILAVGGETPAPVGFAGEIRELRGAVVCAGFIDPWSIAAVTGDSVEDQNTGPASLTTDGLDGWLDAHLRREALAAGVIGARVQAGVKARMGGVGAVVRLDGEGPLDVLLPDACVHATIGVTRGRRAGDAFERIAEVDRLVAAIESGRGYRENHVEYRYELEEWQKAIAEKEAELEKDFKKAKKARDKEIEKAEEDGKEFKEERYKEDKPPRVPKVDPDDEVMARVAHGELPLIVEVHGAIELRSLLAATAGYERLRLIIAGGSEALAVAEELAEREVPVIVWPAPLGLERPGEHRLASLDLAAELHAAGVPVLLGSGATGTAGTRDLPLYASLAVGHGLDREAALAALTLGAARALDVADRLGSVEVGKDAELLVLSGDPLSTTTRVQHVITGGAVIDQP